MCRILEAGTMESKVANASVKNVENALMTRRASTLKIMKYLLKAIDGQRVKHEELSSILCERLAEDGEALFGNCLTTKFNL